MLLLYIMCNHLLLSLKLSIDIILYWNSVIHVDFKSGSIDVELKIYDYNFVALAIALVKVTKGIHSQTTVISIIHFWSPLSLPMQPQQSSVIAVAVDQ